MAKRLATGWRSAFSYVATAAAALVLLPFAIPIAVAVYAVVWLYTWTHDPRARTHLLQVLPLHPRRVYRCSRALWSGMLDGLGGPTIAIILSYLATKLSRSSRPQDTAVRDIKYGPQAKHRLDLFVPLATQGKPQEPTPSQRASTESKKFPILVIFPGYRWSKTKRARLYRPMAQTLCADGMFVVLPRIGGLGASLEDILCDFHLTVQWVFENALNFGGDPKRVHLLGYGASAHLCTMYSLVVPLKTWYAQADRISPDAQLLPSRASDQCLRQWLRRIKRIPRPVAGLILVSGVFDIASQRKYETERCIEHLSATSKTFGGRKELEEAWSPSTIVRCLRRRSAYIPAELFAQSVLLIHGKRDSTFVLAQSQRLFRELCEIDVPDVNMKIYANLRRVDPSIALLAPSSALAMSLLDDIRSSVSPFADHQDNVNIAREEDHRRGGGSANSFTTSNGTQNQPLPEPTQVKSMREVTSQPTSAASASASTSTNTGGKFKEDKPRSDNSIGKAHNTSASGEPQFSTSSRQARFLQETFISPQQQRRRQQLAPHIAATDSSSSSHVLDRGSDYFSQQRQQSYHRPLQSFLSNSNRSNPHYGVAVSGAN
ncbi:hypothetical protein GGI25_005203 [Coemansia spiralis]|uniref:Alpha/beta-hydrolase n=2 Tax=Coemansia TaxID=4863 RepID=A0A9W8G310_9FUNG|nr:hypothetical protein EDC05_004121 [Coemansia umbellata]KAJ2620750.1 hypothetical protein GGI26_004738 [Coemansia sp. RSA 1358]KAJ2672171.1 hypothetical protein GGI25_005203 [Coemansia spiralis]